MQNTSQTKSTHYSIAKITSRVVLMLLKVKEIKQNHFQSSIWEAQQQTMSEPVQYQSVAFKGCPSQLLNGHWTTLVPAEGFSVSYLLVKYVCISMGI